jgi:hypothetical protein
MRLRLGIDLGKVNDSSAVTVCEVTDAPMALGHVTAADVDAMAASMAIGIDPLSPLGILGVRHAQPAYVDPLDHLPGPRVPSLEPLYTARHIERAPLGTPYTDVAIGVRVIVQWLRQQFPRIVPELYVDATGVGIPVVDILRRELAGIPHRLVPVTIVSGDGYHDVVTADGADRKGRVVPRSARGLSVGKGFLVSRLQALLQTQRLVGPRTMVAELQDELRVFETRAKEGRDQYGARTGSHDDLVLSAALSVLDRPRQGANAVVELNAELTGPRYIGFGGPSAAWDPLR